MIGSDAALLTTDGERNGADVQFGSDQPTLNEIA